MIISPLCIILPQMSGYIKYSENGQKICHLRLKMNMFISNTIKYRIKLKMY